MSARPDGRTEVPCPDCGGAGRWHDCGEDACCCAPPVDDDTECSTCEGSGSVRTDEDIYDDEPFFDPTPLPILRDWPRPTWRKRLRWLWWRLTGRRGPDPRDWLRYVCDPAKYEHAVVVQSSVFETDGRCPHEMPRVDMCFLCSMAGGA